MSRPADLTIDILHDSYCLTSIKPRRQGRFRADAPIKPEHVEVHFFPLARIVGGLSDHHGWRARSVAICCFISMNDHLTKVRRLTQPMVLRFASIALTAHGRKGDVLDLPILECRFIYSLGLGFSSEEPSEP